MSQNNIYSSLHPAAFFFIQRRLRIIRRILADRFPGGVSDTKLLEVGCGNAQWLAEFQMFDFRSTNMAGIEIDQSRVDVAKARVPESDIRCGDAENLPWEDDSFDIVFQSTVFTSVPEMEKKERIAAEMKRVCKKDGIILWYDFIYNNPNNPNVHGVGKQEIKKLFTPWNCEFYRVTLAPPIVRRMIHLSWLLTEITETFLPFLCTHVLAIITPSE